MPNIATVLKDEIARVARKEIRSETADLKKASARYRRDIASLKREVADLNRKVALLEKKVLTKSLREEAPVDRESIRFSAKALRSNRKRLKLSAAQYAKLAGVSLPTIYNWERESSRPRKSQLPALAALRGIGRTEALARLEQIQ
jgi:DNA-binding transcriptional regulator YiaG